MPDFTSILLEAEKKKHPLTAPVAWEETQSLVGQLIERLRVTEGELDFSPSSLNKLENQLVNYCNTNFDELEKDDEVLPLIREIAGYIGAVLVLHANGTWKPLNTLWNTHIEFRNVSVTKDGKSYDAPELVYSLGNIASVTLDKIYHNIKPNLIKYYRNAKKKIFKEA